jgi:7,8-dihydroneopterin aldolase/epimerase/oxygenase
MSMDHITLTGLRVHAHHGVFDFEREAGQEFVTDVTAWLDFAAAARGDELAATVHYGELAVAVVDAVKRDPVDLIETLAERIASVVLGFSAVQRTRVTVHKPNAPIEVPFDDVSVTIERGHAGNGPAESETR